MTSPTIDSDNDDGSVPWFLTAVWLGTRDGAVFRVGTKCILVFMGTGSHDDCSLGSHNHVLSTHFRVLHVSRFGELHQQPINFN